MKKIALVAALVAGFASAAVAEDAANDSVRTTHGAFYGVQTQQMIEGRNVYSPTAPKAAEDLWFERESDNTSV